MGTLASTLVDHAEGAIARARPGWPAIQSRRARAALAVAAYGCVLVGAAAGASVVAWLGAAAMSVARLGGAIVLLAGLVGLAAAAPILARHAATRVALDRR